MTEGAGLRSILWVRKWWPESRWGVQGHKMTSDHPRKTEMLAEWNKLSTVDQVEIRALWREMEEAERVRHKSNSLR